MSRQDIVAVAPTGNSRCRACRESIAKGSWRFGEWRDADSLYYTGHDSAEAHHAWYHVECAAIALPTAALDVLRSDEAEEIPDLPWFTVKAAIGVLRRKKLDVEEVLWLYDDADALPHTIFRTPEDDFVLITKADPKVKVTRLDRFIVEKATTADDAFALLPEALFRAAQRISVTRPPAPKKSGDKRQNEKPRSDVPLGDCPACKAPVIDAGGTYACQLRCGFRFSKTILGLPIEPDQLAKWLSDDAATDFLDGFISKKTGRPFRARLTREGTEMKFEFPERGER